jgi:hypothetical protein
MFHLAREWGAVEKALPAVKMVPGELHRERVLTAAEEDLFFRGAGTGAMEQHADPRLLADVILISRQGSLWHPVRWLLTSCTGVWHSLC